MSSLRDQLWPIFIEEVGEQIDALEALLDASARAEETPDVNALFRHFHTIKSNGSMMDFHAIEQLAHASEDMLFVLRETSQEADETCASLLIQCVDMLKQQLDHVSRFRSNPADAPELIAALAIMSEQRRNNTDAQTTDEQTDATLAISDDIAQPQSREHDQDTMRVNTHTLDDLVASVGNMAMRVNRLSHVVQDETQAQQIQRARRILPRLTEGHVSSDDVDLLHELVLSLDVTHTDASHADQSIQTALTRIEQDVMDLRVIPISVVFNRLPILVNKTADQSGKTVALIMEGAEVRIDKRMVDTLMEPLVHIVRNAIDHGIETPAQRHAAGKPPAGTLTIRAEQDAGMLVLDIQDDGNGLDTTRIMAKARNMGLVTPEHRFTSDDQIHALIFTPGFSTSDTVTETSGRGVGMDVVKTHITRLGGRIDVHSSAGRGTRFRLQIPLSVAIQRVLLVKLQQQVYALALRAVSEIISATSMQTQITCNQSVVLFRDDILPVASLAALIGLSHTPSTVSRPREIVVLRNQDAWLGVYVDEVIGEQELIVREVHGDIAALPGLAGVSLLADGNVVIILDSDYLLTQSALQSRQLEAIA